MTDYLLFMTLQPIRYEHIEALTKLGVIVPFDSKVREVNLYGYYPKDTTKEAKAQIVKLVGETTFTDSVVPLDQIQKQQQKLQESNIVGVGDIVFHRDYKRLPFIVTQINDTQATITHNLRTRPLEIECDRALLRLASNITELPTYQTQKPKVEFKGKVYLDCDIFNAPSIDDYYRLVFLTLMRLRLAFISYEIVLVNPIPQDNDILSHLGFESVCGNLLALVSTIAPSLLVSNSKLIDYPNTRSYDNTKFTKPKFIVDAKTDSQVHIYGLISKDKHTKELLLRIKNNQADPIPTQTPQYDPTIATHPATQVTNYPQIKSKLRSLELDSYITRLDEILYTLKGETTCKTNH